MPREEAIARSSSKQKAESRKQRAESAKLKAGSATSGRVPEEGRKTAAVYEAAGEAVHG